MKWVLFIAAILCFADGGLVYNSAATIMQQGVGVLIILIGTVAFSAAAIIDAIQPAAKHK